MPAASEIKNGKLAREPTVTGTEPTWSDELGAQQRQDFWAIVAAHKAKMGQKSEVVTDQPDDRRMQMVAVFAKPKPAEPHPDRAR